MEKERSCGFLCMKQWKVQIRVCFCRLCQRDDGVFIFPARRGSALYFLNLLSQLDAKHWRCQRKVHLRVHFSPTLKKRHPKWATIINSTLIRRGRACGIPIAEKRHLYTCQQSICSWKGRYKHKNCNPIPTEISIHDSNCEGVGPVSLN